MQSSWPACVYVRSVRHQADEPINHPCNSLLSQPYLRGLPKLFWALLLDDDRAVVHGESARDAAVDEQEWMSQRTYPRLASRRSCSGGLSSLPCSLAQGDVRAILERLAPADPSMDEACAKIRKLFVHRANRFTLEGANAMLREGRLSTAIVKQLHGTDAGVHKLFAAIGEHVLTTVMRPLLALSGMRAAEAKLQLK